jgi:O-antigen/teichoic acid export membrane protein
VHPIPRSLRIGGTTCDVLVKGRFNVTNSSEISVRASTRIDYAVTYLSQAVVAVAVLLSFRLVKSNFAEMGLEEFSVMRRSISFVLPVLSLGLGIALTRTIALRLAARDRESLAGELMAATAVTVVVSLLLTILIVVARRPVASLLWGAGSRTSLSLALIPPLWGTLLHMVAYAFLRGQTRSIRAALLNVCNLGLLPLCAVVSSDTIEAGFVQCGILSAVVAGSTIILSLAGRPLPSQAELSEKARRMLEYGAPRLPGDLALAAIFFLPVFATTQIFGLSAGGHVAYALSLVTLMQMLVSPFSTLLLPQASRLLGQGNYAAVRACATRAMAFATIVSGCAAAAVILAADPLLRIHLGQVDPELIATVRLTILASVPFNLYVALRSIVDAASERALNAQALMRGALLSAVATAIVAVAVPSPRGPVIVMLVSLAYVAFATVERTRRLIHDIAPPEQRTPPAANPKPSGEPQQATRAA